MKKLSLKTYNIYSLKRIDENHSLKIKNMLNDVEYRNPRLLAPLACFLYLGNYSDMSVGPKLSKVVKEMFSLYPNVNEENALEYMKKSDNVELNKYYNSFVSENMRRDENEIKNKLRNGINKIKNEKKISNYRICKLANIDVGNFHSFLELKRNEKLSVKNLENVLNVCIKY